MKTNQQVVEAMYDAFGKGNVSFILETVSENFTWTDPSNPAIAPQGGTYAGRKAMGNFFQNMVSSVDTTLFEINNYLSAGDIVVASGKHGVKVKSTGKNCVINWIMIWDFENGQPIKGRSAFDAKTYESNFV